MKAPLEQAGICGASRFRLAFDPPPADVRLATRLGMDRYLIADVDSGCCSVQVCERILRAASGVFELAEPDAVGESHGQQQPNDTHWGIQWALSNTGQTVASQQGTAGADIEWLAARVYAASAATVTVAVLDTGLSPTHPDLAGRSIQGRNVTSGNGGNPLNTADSLSNSHGTKCSGIIAAIENNGFGIAGIAANAVIMPVKIQVGTTVGAAYAAQGLTWAADNGAGVASMSWGISGTAANLAMLRSAVEYAHGRGVVMVASTGNVPGAEIGYPAAWPEVMAIGGTDNRDRLALFSTTGPAMDMVAPGASIMTTVDQSTNPNGFALENGTSFAAPMVAAVAAMVRGINPNLSASEVREILVGSSLDLGAAGYDPVFGWGRLNAHNAVREALATLPLCPADVNANRVVDLGDLFLYYDLYFLYNGQASTPSFVDFNHDGVVNGGDLFAFLDAWFRGC